MNAHARAAYVNHSITTADPQRLLVMLCERLVLDVQRAREAQLVQDLPGAHNHLVHAQKIVLELRSSLDTEGFDGALKLAALYDYLDRRLVQANVRKDFEITEECLGLSRHIADTWRQAALALAQTA